MRKLFLILFLTLLFYGCDGVEDGIVDPSTDAFNVTSLEAPTILKYTSDNTELVTSLSFSSTEAILLVWVKVSAQDGSYDITYHTNMEKTTENEYSVSISMSPDMPSTIYTIDYLIETKIYSEKKIASHNFEYDNLQNNSAPIISNPLFYYVGDVTSLMDTIQNGEVNQFILSIEVADSNGLSDIDSVYVDLFNYQDENNTVKTPKITLYDDGNDDHGDMTANDGTYSRKGFFPDDSEGNRKFDFIAVDRQGVRSNNLSHNFVVVK